MEKAGNKEKKFKILLIDDEEKPRDQWERIITEFGEKISDYQIFKEKNGSNAIELLSKNSDLKTVFIDKFLGNEKEDGILVSKKIKENFSDVYVILVTAFGLDETKNRKSEISDALNKNYIDYFIEKDHVHFIDEMLKARDAAIQSLNNPLQRETIKQERIRTLTLIKDFKVDRTDDFSISEILIGKSKAIQELKKWIVKFAKAKDPIPVLITGETGTGKEIVANLIHELSHRKNKPFIPINCAAIPSELIESELFGHVKGAFTSALYDKKGKFEMADKGTLFLDEFGDLSLWAQAKILRAIQEGKIDKVGGQENRIKKDKIGNETDVVTTKELNIHVDVRIICATNKDLKEIVEKEMRDKTIEKFRPDLFYRLSGFHLRLVPLRDRLQDIPDLVRHFIKDSNVSITPKSLDLLQNDYNWPGNIRELKSFIDSLSNLFPEKSPFEVELVNEALNLWKGMHPETNFLFSENSDKLNKLQDPTYKNNFSSTEIKEMKDFLILFFNEYQKYEKEYGIYPTQTEIEKILEPENSKGWLSTRFTRTQEQKRCELAKKVINETYELDSLKKIAPFKKLF